VPDPWWTEGGVDPQCSDGFPVWGKGKNGIEMANLIPDVRVVLWFDISEREIDV
jgi:hypothetical protein